MVMNDMVKDFTDDDIEKIIVTNEKEIKPNEDLKLASEKFKESKPDLLEKQPQSNIPAKGLINRTTETSSITLEGKKGNIQRKIREERKINK